MKRALKKQEQLELMLSKIDPMDSEADDIDDLLDSDFFTSSGSDDETEPHQPRKRARLGTTGCIPYEKTEVAKDGTVWRKEQVGARLHTNLIETYGKDGEPADDVRRGVTSRLQSFLRFVTFAMLNTIQENTVLNGKQTEEHWDMPVHELMAFVAIVILRGVFKLPTVDDYWAEKSQVTQVAKIMPRNRFQSILKYLCFDDMSTRGERIKADKFAEVSDVWGSFVGNCISSYRPGQHIAVDEKLFHSKTSCFLSFWVACDLKSKYILNAIPYFDGERGEKFEKSEISEIVMRLVKPYLDQGRNVCTDNFFTSQSLARRLLRRKTTILGTLDQNSRETPPSTRKRGGQQFTTQVFATAKTTLTVYGVKQARKVHILSTMHDVVRTEETTERKPNTFIQYNNMKCGLDEMDQMVRPYSVRQRTRRWPVGLFYNLIDMAALNAHVLFQACTRKQEERKDFLVELAYELARVHVGTRKAREEQVLQQQPSKKKSH